MSLPRFTPEFKDEAFTHAPSTLQEDRVHQVSSSAGVPFENSDSLESGHSGQIK